MSFEHSIKDFLSASRLSGAGVPENLNSRLYTDIPTYETVHPPHPRQGAARWRDGFLSGYLLGQALWQR